MSNSDHVGGEVPVSMCVAGCLTPPYDTSVGGVADPDARVGDAPVGHLKRSEKRNWFNFVHGVGHAK